MPLPDLFQFSQGKLQDYVDCPRRFQLRYVLMQPWPALVVEPPDEAELQMRRGSDFHRLAQQQALGLEPERLEVHPTAPRCTVCQENYERTRGKGAGASL